MQSRYIAITGEKRAECAAEELDTAGLRKDEYVISAEASMISAGTELSRFLATKRGFSYPVRPGYSAAGRVLACGEGSGYSVGDRVFFSGPHASISRFAPGEKTQGPCMFPLPDDVSFKEGTIANLGLVAMSGVLSAEIKPGDVAAVFGMGAIGLITALLLKESGADVIAVDPVSSRCDFAKSLGIKTAVDCPPGEQSAKIKELTDGRGADIAFDVTGSSAAIINAILSCGRYAQAVLLGSPRAPYDAGDITPVFSAIHMNMIRVVGAFNNLWPLHEKEGSRLCADRNYRAVMARIADKRIDADRIISHVIAPDDIQSAYDGLAFEPESYRCVVIDWTK